MREKITIITVKMNITVIYHGVSISLVLVITKSIMVMVIMLKMVTLILLIYQQKRLYAK